LKNCMEEQALYPPAGRGEEIVFHLENTQKSWKGKSFMPKST